MSLPTMSTLDWFVAVATLLGFAYAVLRPLVRKLWTPIAKQLRRYVEMVDKVDRIDGNVSRIDAEVTAIKRRVEAELGPNGGGSMKDQVTTIEARQSAIFDSMERAGFQADAAGQFISVNRAFEKLTGYPARDLLGMQWVNLIHQDQADDFMEMWYHVIRDGRPLRRSCRIVTADRIEVLVYVDAMPVKVGHKVREWQGSFMRSESLV